MIALWTWFVSTRIGRWIVGIVFVVAGLAAALFVVFKKGEKDQRTKDVATQAKAAQADAQAAASVQADAAQAVQKVQEAAAKQTPPDTVKRNDLDTTF